MLAAAEQVNAGSFDCLAGGKPGKRRNEIFGSFAQSVQEAVAVTPGVGGAGVVVVGSEDRAMVIEELHGLLAKEVRVLTNPTLHA